MTGKEFLEFLHVAERLKSVTRHCYTADGTPYADWSQTLSSDSSSYDVKEAQ